MISAHTGAVLCVAIFPGLFPVPGMASPKELSFSAFMETANYMSDEYRFGMLFNRENGTLTGSYLRGGYIKGPWRSVVEYRNISGTIDYQGQTQFGIPIESQTDLKYSQSGILTAYQAGNTPLYAGIALRSRDLERRIRATPITQALHETLRQTEWGPVVGAAWDPAENISFSVQFMALITERSTLDVDFLGSYDAGKLTLPRNSSRDLQITLLYRIDPSYSFAIEVCGQRFTPEKSSPALLTTNGIPVGLYNYPGSTQDIWTLGAGAVIRW